MTHQQITYARELSRRLMGITAMATAAGAGRGVDTNGKPLPEIERKLSAAWQEIESVGKWAKDNKP